VRVLVRLGVERDRVVDIAFEVELFEGRFERGDLTRALRADPADEGNALASVAAATA